MKKTLILTALVLLAAVSAFPQSNGGVLNHSSFAGGGVGASASSGGTAWFFCDPVTGTCSMGGLVRPSANIFRVTSDFTSASSTALQAITGLTFTLPANTADVYPFRCEILYAQATAAVSDAFGIQAATYNPTNIMAKGDVATSASAITFGNLPTLATTTATSVVTFTPSAITTVWNARLSGLIENPYNSSAQTVNVMVSQSTAGDLITIKRGSYCVIGF